MVPKSGCSLGGLGKPRRVAFPYCIRVIPPRCAFCNYCRPVAAPSSEARGGALTLLETEAAKSLAGQSLESPQQNSPVDKVGTTEARQEL